MTPRACTVCGVVQPHYAFPVRHGYHIGKCLDCERAHRRAWNAAQNPGDKPMAALASLTDRWTVVARRVRITSERDGWEWELPPREVSVLHIGVAHGSIILAHRREPDGTSVQVAKLARKQAREGEAFALAGRGMFEQ